MHFESSRIVGGNAVPPSELLAAFRRRTLPHFRGVAVRNSFWTSKSFSLKQNDRMKCRKIFTDREVVTSQDLILRHQLREVLKPRQVLLYEATKDI